MQIRKETISRDFDRTQKWKDFTDQSKGRANAECAARSGNGETGWGFWYLANNLSCIASWTIITSSYEFELILDYKQ